MTRKEWSNMTIEQQLASMTLDQLNGALARGRSQMAMLDAELFSDPGDDFEGPFPPSKNLERFNQDYDFTMRNHLIVAMRDVERELARRFTYA